jgi:hypothetical protein
MSETFLDLVMFPGRRVMKLHGDSVAQDNCGMKWLAYTNSQSQMQGTVHEE